MVPIIHAFHELGRRTEAFRTNSRPSQNKLNIELLNLIRLIYYLIHIQFSISILLSQIKSPFHVQQRFFLSKQFVYLHNLYNRSTENTLLDCWK